MCLHQLFCNHGTKTNFLCKELVYDDLKKFHNKFYSSVEKLKQDAFSLKYTDIVPTKRYRPKTEETHAYPDHSCRYFILKGMKKLQVYKPAFLKMLLVRKNRVDGVVKWYLQSDGAMPTERRGGFKNHSTYEEKWVAVIRFIKKFKGVESHYCRTRSSSRIYLSSDLNISKMFRMYNWEVPWNIQVTHSLFHFIFRTCFNIGFGSPRTNKCSTCLQYKFKINHALHTPLRGRFEAELRLYKLKAKAFYNHLCCQDENIQIISFDCHKNQPLPKVSNQAAYYSRQIYIYNLAIVVGNSRMPQSNDNVFLYYWDETQHKKGSNKISSAVFDFLHNFLIMNPQTTIPSVCCDGCGGQNKNTVMISMLSFWLLRCAPDHVQEVQVIYPKVGHSFLPSDHVSDVLKKFSKYRTPLFHQECM